MLERLDLRGSRADLAAVLAPLPAGDEPVAAVRQIVAAVRDRGDEALRELTERFDGCRPNELRVPAPEVLAALDAVPSALRTALEYAAAEITAYHEAQRPAP